MSEDPPYLSVVVGARNDTYGGDPMRRLRLFVDGLLAQCDRHALDAEVVIVEWNPPADRPRIADALEPRSSRRCAVRVITVPAALHETLPHADRVPLLEFSAKNVGIRRTHGQFVLASNLDILLSDELVAYLAQRILRPARLYRVDRIDVPADAADLAMTVDERLRRCAASPLRRHGALGSIDYAAGEQWQLFSDPTRLSAAVSRLVERASDAPSTQQVADSRVGTFAASRAARLGVDARYLRHLARRGLEHVRLLPAPARPPASAAGSASLPHPSARTRAFLAAWRDERRVGRTLHTNASGDFTLMHRRDWLRTGGYPELAGRARHLDGVLVHQAHWLGVAQRVLPFPIFHLEHEGGWAEAVKVTEAAPAADDLPRVTYGQYEGWLREMRARRGPLHFNDDTWGFANLDLPETIVS